MVEHLPPVSLAFLSSCRSYDANYSRGDCSLTQATDTTNIRLVFAAVKETILQNALKDSKILRYAFRLCFSAGKSCVRVFYQISWSDVGNAQVFSSCPRIFLLVAAIYVSVSRGLHRPSLIVLQFTSGKPHPRPLHPRHQQTDSLAPFSLSSMHLHL
jgi:hypothetical protein